MRKEDSTGPEWDAGEPPTGLHEKGKLNWTESCCITYEAMIVLIN